MYKYILQPYKGKKTRFTCPNCSKENEFTRYIDIESGEYIDNKVGKCNREVKCGYHFGPGEYFMRKGTRGQRDRVTGGQRDRVTGGQRDRVTGGHCDNVTKSEPISYIKNDLMVQSCSHPELNNLVTYLLKIYDQTTVTHLLNIYKIGTSKYYGGGTTVFWQIDNDIKVRSGKLIHYDPITGHRDKSKQTTWVHAIHPDYSKPKEFNLCQCLFGEHLLREDSTCPIALVESEKTAIIAMARMPQYLWMATGSLNEFKPSKLEILRNRIVIAFPDLGAYEKWKDKASLLPFRVEVSDYLERNASDGEREMGLDIGDFLGKVE